MLGSASTGSSSPPDLSGLDRASGFISLLDHMPVPIVIHQVVGTDEQGFPISKAVFHNRRFIDEVGYEIADTPNNHVWMQTVYPDEDYRQGVIHRWKKARAEAALRGDTFAEAISCVRCKDGKSRWYKIAHDFQSQLHAGYMVFAFIDVTALKRELVENEKLAFTDPLTGLMNRRAIDSRLEAVRERALESKQAYGCAIGDIDLFKTINDTFGHDCGDRALQLIADAARESIRPDDAIARWGGEEFMFVFPAAGAADMQAALEALRVRLREINFSWAGQRFPLTLTFGATWSDGREPAEVVISRAVKALLRGKANGRDRIVLSTEEDSFGEFRPSRQSLVSAEKRRLLSAARQAYEAHRYRYS